VLGFEFIVAFLMGYSFSFVVLLNIIPTTEVDLRETMQFTFCSGL
jgi:hypothetical protein